MKIEKEASLATRQKELQAYIREYGITAAAEGTGLAVCDIRSSYTDAEPIYDHLVRLYQFYRGLEHEQSLHDRDYAM